MTLAAIPPSVAPMPDVLWVTGSVESAGNDALRFRIGEADGPELADARVHSSWRKGDQPLAGVSVRRALQGWAKTRARLASQGWLPIAEVEAAGYHATGQERAVGGMSWREFKKFDDRFNSWSVGWWLRVRALW
jgi:hypothetical protein